MLVTGIVSKGLCLLMLVSCKLIFAILLTYPQNGFKTDRQ